MAIEVEDKTAEGNLTINVRVESEAIALELSRPVVRISLAPAAAHALGQLLIVGAANIMKDKN